MSDALDLTRAILGERDDARALRVLEAALEREVDVLRYCAATLGLGTDLVMERAASWAGYAFYERVPPGVIGDAQSGMCALRNAELLQRRVDVLAAAVHEHELFAAVPRRSDLPQRCSAPH